MASEPQRDDEPPASMEAVVLRTLHGGGRSREGWEELRGEDEPPLSDLQVFLENMIGAVERQGMVLAQLAMVPATRARLQERAGGAVERIPAWMDAAVYGSPLMTPRLFVRGLAQLLSEQREGFERVLREQVADPEPIEETLAEAPIPEGGEDEEDNEITRGVGDAMVAHMQALLDIARDFDDRLRVLLGGDPDDAAGER